MKNVRSTVGSSVVIDEVMLAAIIGASVAYCVCCRSSDEVSGSLSIICS